jgi:hypothetical protein
VSSTIRWVEQGATIKQTAGFPYSSNSTTSLTVSVETPTPFTMKVRVPSWAEGSISLTINGKAVVANPGTYATITRTWMPGDTVDVHFEMTLWASAVEDDRASFNSTFAYMYGPLVLAGLTDTNTFIPDGSAANPSAFITRTSNSVLNFTAVGNNSVGDAVSLPMIPLFEVMDETYCVYFTTTGASRVPYAVGGATVPSASSGDWHFENAGTTPTRQAGASVDLRTAGPNTVSTLTISHPIIGQHHRISEVSLSFRYVAGYDSGAGAWPTVSVVLRDAIDGNPVETIWTSSPLEKYQFDKFTGWVFACIPHGSRPHSSSFDCTSNRA